MEGLAVMVRTSTRGGAGWEGRYQIFLLTGQEQTTLPHHGFESGMGNNIVIGNVIEVTGPKPTRTIAILIYFD